MNCSVLMVSHNRKKDLQKSLKILESQIDIKTTEVIVFLDGCSDGSLDLRKDFKFVRWISSPTNIGASAARAQIYAVAQSEILIGLDDDAHFLTSNFLLTIKTIFDAQPNTALIAFEEVKGIFKNDFLVVKKSQRSVQHYLCSEFIGCGFAIRKSMYLQTNGFPTWIDIYGEESCLAIEIISKGFDIVYDSSIKVNHRIDFEKRKKNGQNYFRFGKQLKNVTFYFMVYYENPFLPILKLWLHNFRKYALIDFQYFKVFCKAILLVFINLTVVLKFRKPIKKEILKKIQSLPAIKY